MNILILNWRDSRDPDSGGAEILTHEMAKRWVKEGHDVTQFSAEFPRVKKQESIDGVKIIRGGSAMIRSWRMPVHLSAFLWYQKHGKNKFDVVIDEIHGSPFFTPLYVKEKKVVLICEVANEIWDAVFQFPINVIGRLVEHLYFYIYRKIPFLTISSSTKDDLIAKGVKSTQITVLPMGLTIPSKVKIFSKEVHPTLLFVGRIAKSKGIEDALGAMRLILQRFPKCKLWIVGHGNPNYVEEIRKKIDQFSLTNSVEMFGFVSQKKKFELMSRAHILLVPSVKEGWGLIVPEAGYVKTPAVAYDVAGLRDIIQSGKNGILCRSKPHYMAEAVMELLANVALYKTLQDGANTRASGFDWDKTADRALSIIKSQI